MKFSIVVNIVEKNEILAVSLLTLTRVLSVRRY